MKTINFKNPVYLGDPVNILRIFNEKGADEVSIFDIEATRNGAIRFDALKDLVEECFMPVSYGGGVRTIDDFSRCFDLGVEKVVVNSSFIEVPGLVERAASRFGSQSVAVCLDVKEGGFLAKPRIRICSGERDTGLSPIEAAQLAESQGAGEIVIQSIDRDGTLKGYAHDIIAEIAASVSVPVIAAGGAATFDDMANVISKTGAHAAAAGALFVFSGKHRAVLVQYPREKINDFAYQHAKSY